MECTCSLVIKVNFKKTHWLVNRSERSLSATCSCVTYNQGCALEAPWCHRQLTFALGQLEKKKISYLNLRAGHPGFYG